MVIVSVMTLSLNAYCRYSFYRGNTTKKIVISSIDSYADGTKLQQRKNGYIPFYTPRQDSYSSKVYIPLYTPRQDSSTSR